jgi:hypothetical protein
MRRIIEELGWHTDHPSSAAKLLTPKEAEDILKRGFVSKSLWEALQPRIAAQEAEQE